MELAGRYAYAGRDWVCDRVTKILGGLIVEEIHNHHNFAWRENHFGKDLWVVRKGATPAFPGQRGFVGGSMGDLSVILEGVEGNLSAKSLYSTVHGAGRAMGRMQAKGKIDRKTGRRITPGLISKEMHANYMASFAPEARGGALDESPLAYKRIDQVLEAHKGTIKIIHQLKPIGVCMASDREFDPYKD
jgi:tRNA-splicing ligase RtcB